MNHGNTYRRQQIAAKKDPSRIEKDLSSFYRQIELWNSGDRMLRTTTARWITRRQPHVCVIGAGAAGLRCADILLDAGIKVTINEARDRIGGRVGIKSVVQTLSNPLRSAKRTCMAMMSTCK